MSKSTELGATSNVVSLRPGNSRAVPPARALPREGTLPAPFDRVHFEVNPWCWNEPGLSFRYCGSHDDLIGCGAISAKFLDAPRSYARTHDEDGDEYHRNRRGEKLVVSRRKPLERAAALPGFEPWMRDAARHAIRAHRTLTPAQWRSRRLEELQRVAGWVAMLSDPTRDDSVTRAMLQDGYNIPLEDRHTWISAVERALADLERSFKALRIVPTLAVIENVDLKDPP